MKASLHTLRSSPTAKLILILWLFFVGWKVLLVSGKDFTNTKDPVAIAWDAYGYYMYLPATFIYSDPFLEKREWEQKIFEDYKPSPSAYHFRNVREGRWVNIYLCGHAILWSPGFFVAHLLAEPLGYPADGFSLPYQFSVLILGLVYSLLGMIFLRKLLLRYFSEKVALFALGVVILGTNFPVHGLMESVGPHGIMFMLLSGFLLALDHWTNAYKWKYALCAGILLGLAILVRPTAILWILLPLTWQVKSWSELLSRLMNFLRPFRFGFLIYGMAGLICIIQMIYWKQASGHWVFFADDIERFTLSDPYTFLFLFSFQKGWLIYTPIMFFLIPALYESWKRLSFFFVSVLVLFIAHTYLLSSWECWWFSESFGQRPMIDVYPLLALPIAWMLDQWLSQPKGYRKIFLGVLGLMIALNLFQIWQFMSGIIHPNRMTREYYAKIFLSVSKPENADELLEWNDAYLASRFSASPPPEYFSTSLWNLDMEDELSDGKDQYATSARVFSGKRSFRMDDQAIFSPTFQEKFRNFSLKDYGAFRFNCKLWLDSGMVMSDAFVVFSMRTEERLYGYAAFPIKDLPLENAAWNNIEFTYFNPYLKHQGDEILVYIWNAGKSTFYIDDMSVTLLDPKRPSVP